MPISAVVTPVTVAAGAVSLLGTATSVWLARRQRRAALKRLNDVAEFKRALQSRDLQQVAHYLFDHLGPITISSYTADKQIRERVSLVLRETESYLRHTSPEWEGLPRADQGELGKAAAEIRAGEIWNGYAKLRHAMWISLNDVVGTPGKGSIGSLPDLIDKAESAGHLSSDSAGVLRQAAATAAHLTRRGTNAEVSPAEAASMLRAVQGALSELKSRRP